MSVNRVCPNCFQVDAVRFNFGEDREAEREFHSQKWCNCGYKDAHEMMIDQDLGFKDPNWLKIAKYFLENYHLRITQGEIHSKEELVRFFLKLLKSSASDINKSIELIDNNGVSDCDYIYNGKTNKTIQAHIMDNYSISSISFPKQVAITKKSNVKVISLLNKLVFIGFGIIIGLIITKFL